MDFRGQNQYDLITSSFKFDLYRQVEGGTLRSGVYQIFHRHFRASPYNRSLRSMTAFWSRFRTITYSHDPRDLVSSFPRL